MFIFKGEEMNRIERKAPIWTLAFLPPDSVTNKAAPTAASSAPIPANAPGDYVY